MIVTWIDIAYGGVVLALGGVQWFVAIAVCWWLLKPRKDAPDA